MRASLSAGGRIMDQELAGTVRFFQFGPEIRRLIYTTNVIESFHRQLRKTTKTKGMFPTDDALLKSLYLTTIDVQKKWTRRISHWEQILSQLTIMYGERVKLTN